jgi:hypothetical protein
MKDILPKGESLKRAVQWMSSQLNLESNQDIIKLLNEATLRFDLTPKEAEFLFQMYTKK